MGNDNVTGIVLDIPKEVLDNIENADKAIKALEATSRHAATKVKGHFDNTMVSGVNAFIKKVQDAQSKLGDIKMPTIDATGLSAAIQELSKSMGVIDRSATTGSNRLGRIADAMAKLQTANPDPSLFTNIANGIEKIGSTSQQTIDNVKNLSQMMAQLARDIRTVQQAQQAESSKIATATQYNKLYKEQAQIMREITALQNKPQKSADELDLLTKLKNRYVDIYQEIDKLNRKQQTNASELAKAQGKLRNEMAKKIADPAGAINYAKNAKSLNELQAAYKNLKAVMATTKPDTKEWNQMNATLEKTRTRIDEIKKKMGEFKGQAKGVGDISGQLARTLAATFSVSAITGYINKMIQVRAQFELQSTALRAILQNKDEADRIFMQVQQLAMQSPFTIMQITNYTKQLAAYRIESEKLVGTTKMLADVSAGLGVDMGRLILAYGQVKAANYLRACLGKGTRVKLFDGTFKNVEDVVVGDVLMGDDEQPRHVSKLYQGEQMMYRVKYKGGEFRCNEHHILTVYDALCDCVTDVFVTEVYNSPLIYRYQGVRRIAGKYEPFFITVEADKEDTYYGFSIDGNHRFIIEDNIVTHNTEVRQFTEAGLNIAGELANYFSELQGKMISVGDVMDMITKRMVRFEDVEEVFKRVTSAGGLFYDMQKKQSETLWGQLQRIQDAMSIMFNEIGKSHQDEISAILTTIRALINNWRILATSIKTAGGVLGGFYLITKSLVISKWTSTLIAGMKAYLTTIKQTIIAAGGLKAALMSLNFTGWGTIIAGLGLAISAIVDLTSSTSALSEELDRIAGESMTDMYDSIYRFKELADTIKDGNKSYKERNEAMESLNRIYKDILPSEMLEIENIKKISDNYNEATNAIKEYYTEAAKNKAEDAIKNDQEQAWNTLIGHAKDMAAYLKSGQPSLEDLPTGTLKGLIGKSMLELKDEIDKGTTDVNDAWIRFKELFKQTSGFDLEDNFNTRGFRALFGEYTGTYADFYDDIRDIHEKGVESQQEFDAQFAEGFSLQTKAIIAKYEVRKKAVKDFYDTLNTYASLVQSGNLKDESGHLTDLGAESIRELGAARIALNNYLGSLNETRISWDSIRDATQNNTDALLLFNDVQQRVLGGFIQNIKETTDGNNIQAWARRTARELHNIGLGDLQMDIIDIAKTSAKVNGMQLTMLDKLKISANTNYTSAATDAHKLSEAATDNIRKIQESRTQLMLLGRTAAEAQAEAEGKFGNGSTEEQLKKEAEWWDKLSRALGFYEDKEKKSGQQDIWTPRLNLMQKVNKEYEKLLKYYSAEEAKKKVLESFAPSVAEAFKKTEWADISTWGTFDAEATIKRLEALAEKAGGKAKKKILEAVGVLEAELEIKVKEQQIQQAKDDIQKAFDNYELTKTLGNLGLNVDLTYLVGGKPMTLGEIRKDLEDKLTVTKATNGQEERVKTYEDALRKIADMENKEAVERLKNHNKYMLQAMSERVRIEMETAQEISKIRQDGTLDDETKVMAITRAKDEERKKLSQQAWKDFQGSDIYISLFEDVERASTQSINYVLNKLRSLKESLKEFPADQVRAIVKQLEKLETEQAERNPFKALKDNIGDVIKNMREYSRIEKDYLENSAKLGAAKGMQADTQKQVALLSDQLSIEEARTDVTKEGKAEHDKLIDNLKMELSLHKGILKAQGQQVAELETSVATSNAHLETLKAQFKGTGTALQTIVNYAKELSSTIGDVAASMENVFGNMSAGTADTIASVQEILNGMGDMASGIGRAIVNPADIGGYMQAVKGLAGTIGSIFQIGDKKKERQIQRLQDKVENLQKAYEKLGKAIEEAYTYDDYNMAYDQSMRNLEEQRKAIQEQLALEKSKKKADKDRIKEYEDALEQLNETEKQIREDRYREMGSIGQSDYLDEAGNFVSAWLDAYEETGDGLTGLQEHWDDFFKNLVMKQAASAVVSKRMSKYIDQINAAIDSGVTGLPLAQVFANIGENLKSELGDWNEDLKAFFDALGIKGGTGELLLSDLQKGIQNITEPQAAAIEAYLNSMRFAVFEQNNILTNMLEAIKSQYGTSEDNPMLTEVKAIRNLVASIDEKLGRVIVNRNGGAGSYIVKVG
jgi:DNA repair exonuclease SbcCD ATPase subunit